MSPPTPSRVAAPVDEATTTTEGVVLDEGVETTDPAATSTDELSAASAEVAVPTVVQASCSSTGFPSATAQDMTAECPPAAAEEAARPEAPPVTAAPARSTARSTTSTGPERAPAAPVAPAVESGAAPASIAPAGTAWNDNPFAPRAPLPAEKPSTAIVAGPSTCGSPGAGQGSQKGYAPVSAVLSCAAELSIAVDTAARMAQATGPVGIPPADPATRPD